MATIPVSAVVRQITHGRVNPLHPEGASDYRRGDLLYVAAAPRQLWVIASSIQLRGWYPGTDVLAYTYRGANLYHLRVRGIVDRTSDTTSGDVPNVPMIYWRLMSVRRPT